MSSFNDDGKPVVLYVDDDADDRFLLTDAVQSEAPEFVVATADDGYQAIDWLKENADQLPCLVILDLNMPGLNGKEVIKRIKADNTLDDVPLVVFSTSSNPADKKECASYGVEMFTKPVTYSELKVVVRKLLTFCNDKKTTINN